MRKDERDIDQHPKYAALTKKEQKAKQAWIDKAAEYKAFVDNPQVPKHEVETEASVLHAQRCGCGRPPTKHWRTIAEKELIVKEHKRLATEKEAKHQELEAVDAEKKELRKQLHKEANLG